MKKISSSAFLLALITSLSCFAIPEAPALQPQTPNATVGALLTPPELATLNSRWDVLDHKYFKVYYDRQNRLPRYSIYTLTAAMLKATPVKRPNSFRPDPMLMNANIPFVQPSEYKNSGYDRGHMAPYEDFSYSAASGNETFVMSNMCPQSKGLNEQSWKNLEMQVRKWGCGEQRVIVITGPIIEDDMGSLASGLPVPNRFFKIVIDDTPPRKALGFVYNQNDDKSVKYQSRTVAPSDIEAAIQENFENLVPVEDRGIFSEPAEFQDWKAADCRPKKLVDDPSTGE